MHIALNLDVEVQDGTLVRTDRTGHTITFSKAQRVQLVFRTFALVFRTSCVGFDLR